MEKITIKDFSKYMEGKTCPKCGQGQLKQRSGKFGDFYGCTNYPNCKYTFTPKTGGYPEPLPQPLQAPTAQVNRVDHNILLADEIAGLRADFNKRMDEMASYLKSRLN